MIRINNYQGRIIGIKVQNEVAGNLIHDLKNLDLTGETDCTEGKNTEKKTNTVAEDEPSVEAGVPGWGESVATNQMRYL